MNFLLLPFLGLEESRFDASDSPLRRDSASMTFVRTSENFKSLIDLAASRFSGMWR